MSEKLKVELQDSEGNVYYLHTDSSVVFREDGTPIEDSITALEENIKSLNSKTVWTHLGIASDTNKITIPTGATEILAVVRVGDEETLQVPIHVPLAFATDANRYLSAGYYGGTSENARIRIYLTKTYLSINTVTKNGENVTNESAMAVYYKF